MAYDATKPAVADNYSTGFAQSIRDNFDYLFKFGEGGSVTGTPATNAKRYNATNDIFETYTGSWVEMPLNYLKKVGGTSQTVDGTVNFSGTLQEAGSRAWTAATFNPASKANNADPAMTGNGTIAGTFASGGRLYGNGAASNNGLGKVTVTNATAAPTGGSQGDLHFIY